MAASTPPSVPYRCPAGCRGRSLPPSPQRAPRRNRPRAGHLCGIGSSLEPCRTPSSPADRRLSFRECNSHHSSRYARKRRSDAVGTISAWLFSLVSLVCEKRANHPNRAGYRNAGKTRVPGGGNGEHDQPVERQAESKRPGQNAAPFENSTDPKDEAAARRVTRKRKYFFGKNFQRNEVLEPPGREPKPAGLQRGVRDATSNRRADRRVDPVFNNS